MDIIYTKSWETGSQYLYKKLVSILTFTRAVLPYKSLWPNGYSAGLSRRRPGFDSRQGHRRKFCSFFALRIDLVTKKLDFQ